jgi:hypothetical protein
MTTHAKPVRTSTRRRAGKSNLARKFVGMLNGSHLVWSRNWHAEPSRREISAVPPALLGIGRKGHGTLYG